MARKTVDERELELREREKRVKNLEQHKINLDKKYEEAMSNLDGQLKLILEEKDKNILAKKKEFETLMSQVALVKKELAEYETKKTQAKATIDNEVLAYKTKRLEEVEKVVLKKINDELEKIRKNYHIQNQLLVDSVNFNEKELNDAFKEILKVYEKQLVAKKKLVENQIKDLEEAKKKYLEEIEKYQHLNLLQAELTTKEKMLSMREAGVEKIVKMRVEKEHAEIQNELARYKQLYNEYLERYNEVSNDYETLLNDVTSSENIERLELLNQNKNLKQQIAEMLKKYGAENDETINEWKRKAALYETVRVENRRLSDEITGKEAQIAKLQTDNLSVTSLKFKNDALEAQIKVEREYLTVLQEEIENLESRINNTKTSVVAAEAIETPIQEFLNKPELTKKVDEIKWLEEIIENCEASGFKFSKRLFYSFHTSLKTSDMSPLTVLAGVSGTGKSKLPQLYSKFGGLYFISVPVAPDWDSPQSLFGYFNSIEKRFNATTLLRALVSFQKDKSTSPTVDNITDLSDKILIVLLDEMNLAHIELYFSDLLSKLEERRGENKDVFFEVDLGAGNEKYKVCLTENVKWVGTMNEDETTKSLSDKVIDRGNVISFPRPEKFERYQRNKPFDDSAKISKSQWEVWVDTKYELTDEEREVFERVVMDINNKLKSVNRALGHRVWQSIEDYIISHPLVLKYVENDEKREIALRYAFEEALVHKVMPKLRGIDTDGIQRENCLDPILKVLEDNNLLTIIPDYKNALESVTGTFVWDSALYLNNEYQEMEE